MSTPTVESVPSGSRPIPDRFLVAFSFAGEQRPLVRSIAEAVEQLLGPGTVYFDEWFEYYIAGDDADLRLQEIYGSQSELVIPCISERFGGKPWTQAEHRAIRARQMQLGASHDKRDAYRILPLRVGDGNVDGVLFNTICPDVRSPKSIAQTAGLIINRLRLIVPDAGMRPAAASARCIYLAECTADLDDPDKPINRGRMKAFLQELGWTVLPATEYPPEQYQASLEHDLRQCRAFVQLLGPYPWKRGGFDRLQNDTALALGTTRFRFRSSELDLTKVDAAHREVLSASDVVSAGFEDFKVLLKRELALLAQEDNRRDESRGALPPLVAVVIRSADPEPLWEQVFQWLYEQQQIDSYQIRLGETLETRHRKDPCHGFLICCDGTALDDGPLSPRDYLEECRLIQMKEKDADRRPPVGLVYWPPPAPAWARLLRCTPLKLHRILGDAPANLPNFLDAVRRVAQ
jgi:hypothetical protein